MTHYQTLGVEASATYKQIKSAWKRLCSQHHPDRADGDAELMAKINEAYRVLSDERLRKEYDEGRSTSPQEPEDPIVAGAGRCAWRLSSKLSTSDQPSRIFPNMNRMMKQVLTALPSKKAELQTAINKTQSLIRKLEANANPKADPFLWQLRSTVERMQAEIDGHAQIKLKMEKALEMISGLHVEDNVQAQSFDMGFQTLYLGSYR